MALTQKSDGALLLLSNDRALEHVAGRWTRLRLTTSSPSLDEVILRAFEMPGRALVGEWRCPVGERYG